MPISVNPILPVLAAQGAAAPELVLQPGTVVDAKVLQLLADNLVRIAIANISIDVLSQVPLQAGQSLQLAVSQTEGGIRLAMVGQGAGTAAGNVTDTVSLAPGALAEAALNPPAAAAPLKDILTPLERLAVSTAAQSAATQQGGQSQLFANLGVAATTGLPQKLQQAVMQLLAQRTSLDQNLTGDDVRNAFQKSGLFLEASLASGSPAAGVPDLKAALIVLRQTLLTSLGTADSAGPVAQGPGPTVAVTDEAAAAPLAPSLPPDIDTQETLSPQVRLAVTEASARTEWRTACGDGRRSAEHAPGGGAAERHDVLGSGNAERSATGPARQRRHVCIPTHRRRRFAARCRRRSRWRCRRSHRMRRSPPPRIICSTIPMPRSRARPCCRWPHCRIVSMPRPSGSIQRRRGGISKFRS